MTTEISEQIREAHEAALAGSFTIPAGPPVDVGAAGDKDKRAAEWQVRAWRYWHRLGELRFPTSHIAKQLTRVTWSVADGGNEIDPDTAKDMIQTATEGIGEDEASRLIGLNLLVAGEGHYIQTDDGGFRVVSVVDPLRKDLVAEGLRNGLSIRFLSPDPTDTTKAESSVMTALGPAEELLTLEHLSRAQARSRITQSGILLIPNQQAFPAGTNIGQMIQEAASAAIRDERSPSAVVPLVMSLDAELIGKIRHLVFERPYDEKIPGKIELATRRVAMALDIEPSVLLGLADANHWSAWAVTEEVYNAHILPLAQRVAEVFQEVLRIQTGRDLAVIPDGSALLARRSTVRDALDAYAAEPPVVGATFVREAIGATDDDAPTPEELAARKGPAREETVDERPGPPIAASLDYTTGALAGAVALAVDTARSKVGAKLRTKAGKSEKASRTPNSQMAYAFPDLVSETDADRAILEALDGFCAYYATLGGSLTGPQARLLVAEYVKSSLSSPVAAVPDSLIERLREGL